MAFVEEVNKDKDYDVLLGPCIVQNVGTRLME